LWDELKRRGLSKYSVVTTWTRVTDFWQFLLDSKLKEGTNEYAEFRRKNELQFKNAYRPKTCGLTYKDALEAIARISRESSRLKATQLLEGGLRFTESLEVKDGAVVGKGGKTRDVFVSSVNLEVSYKTFLRDLHAVGLKPHDLRKVFLTALAQDGANEFELMEAAGWSSITPARSYINVNKKALSERVKRIQEGNNGNGTTN
jgi:integrase